MRSGYGRVSQIRIFLSRLTFPIATIASAFGFMLRRRERYNAALRCFGLANAIAPERADIMGPIGATLIALGELDAAHSWLRASCGGMARQGYELLCSAHGLAKLGDNDGASTAFLRACDLSPRDVRVFAEAAEFFEMIHQSDSARSLVERALAVRPNDAALAKLAFALSPRDPSRADRLDFVIIGTTGQCNASCLHCPTGKLETAHVPRVPMAMPLFRQIVDNLHESRLPILGGIIFGLFGDGLLDPYVLERAKYVREKLPGVTLVVNTNAAAYDTKKHAQLARYISLINVHCESLDAETYDKMMVPLRLERTQAKMNMIMRDFPRKAQVTMPVSRENHQDMMSVQEYFLERGALKVVFQPLSARCARDQSNFDRLSFDPQPIRCSTAQFDTLTIDCDGTVIACCNDFSRELPLGNAADQSLESLLQDSRRLEMMRAFETGRHAQYPTCARCRADICVPAATTSRQFEKV